MVHFYLLLLLLLLPFGANGADDRGCLPVYYEGRICSLDSYAMHWMNEVYHRQTLLPEHRQMFSSPQKSPLDFLWALHGSPDLAYEEVPLFWVGEKGL